MPRFRPRKKIVTRTEPRKLRQISRLAITSMIRKLANVLILIKSFKTVTYSKTSSLRNK